MEMIYDFQKIRKSITIKTKENKAVEILNMQILMDLKKHF